VYCTCSIFKAEGQEQIREFLGTQGNALSLPAPGHLLPGGALQGLYDNPGYDHDGFFYAVLEKRLA
jgi:16S rRNA (cytosine967-C5)-methyltransferase